MNDAPGQQPGLQPLANQRLDIARWRWRRQEARELTVLETGNRSLQVRRGLQGSEQAHFCIGDLRGLGTA